jgi:hypothetical protein
LRRGQGGDSRAIEATGTGIAPVELRNLGTPAEYRMATRKPDDVSIGKFDILSTYTYAKALLDGESEESAKERGMVAAIMGAKAKGGYASHNDYQTAKTSAEKKKKTTITAESFDRQVADKMGAFFGKAFLPAMEKLVEAGLSYDEVKRLVKIPGTWGAKISGEVFKERAVPPGKAGG